MATAGLTTAALAFGILVFLAFGKGALAQKPQAADPFYLKMLDKAEKDFTRRDYEQAAKNFEIAAFGLAHEKNLLAKAYVYLGVCHYYLKSIARSEEYLLQAAELLGEEEFAALALLESARGDLDKLLIFFNIRPAEKPDPVKASTQAQEKENPALAGKSAPVSIDQIKEGDVIPLEMVEKQPVAVRRIQPLYPPDALRAGIEGTVIVNALVSETGRVIKTAIIRGIKGALELDAAARRAVQRWEFEPATIRGIRVKVWMPVAIEFRKQE